PQPRGERAVQAEPRQVRGDLRAAPVHHDGAEPCVPQEHHVMGEGAAQRVVGHRVPAVLDHHGLAVEPAQPRQRLDEDRRLGGAIPGGRPPGPPAGPGGHSITQGTPPDPGWPGTPDGLWPRSFVTRPWPGRLEWRASGGRGGLRARGRGHVEYAEFSWTYSVVRSVVRMVAAAGPADRAAVFVTSPGAGSTWAWPPAAQPLRHTHKPLIATLIRSGSNAASVVPTAVSTRPQFGSAPAMAHLSRADRATARPAVTASVSSAAPTTSIAMSLPAPSASACNCRARSAQTAVSARVNSPVSGRSPAAPLASSRTVSLVDMQ